MRVVSLDKKVLFTLALFASVVVAALLLLKVSGVQRVDGWVILICWLLVVSGICFSRRRRSE